MAVDGSEINLTQLQIDLLHSEGIYQNGEEDAQISGDLSEYNKWKSKITNRVLRTSTRTAITTGVLGLMVLGVAAAPAVAPGLLAGTVTPIFSSAVCAAVTGLSFFAVGKLNAFRERSNADRSNARFRGRKSRINRKIEALEQKELTPKQQKKLAKLLFKEQKHVEREYFEAMRAWEKLLKKGDVASYIKNPSGEGLESEDFKNFCKWQKVINSIVSRHNDLTEMIKKHGFNENSKYKNVFSSKIRVSDKKLIDFDTKKIENSFKDSKKVAEKKGNEQQKQLADNLNLNIIPKRKSSKLQTFLSNNIKKKKALESDAEAFKAYDDMTLRNEEAAKRDQISSQEIKKRDVIRNASTRSSRSNRNGNAMHF